MIANNNQKLDQMKYFIRKVKVDSKQNKPTRWKVGLKKIMKNFNIGR